MMIFFQSWSLKFLWCGNRYLWLFDYKVEKEISDPNGRYFLMKINIGNSKFVLINIYNENNERDQVRLLQQLDEQIEQLGVDSDTNMVLGGDFDFDFDKTLEAIGGNPQTKL